jgi:hypothetical protein
MLCFHFYKIIESKKGKALKSRIFRIIDFCSTLPNIETPYPMLILSGPEGSGRIELAHRLVEEFSEFFGYG